MSSSFLSGGRLVQAGRRFWPAALALAFAMPGRSAETYIQPTATVSAETNSNLDMDPFSPTRGEDYGVAASALIGVATPDSNTAIKPQIRYADYPQETVLNRVEGVLDFNTDLKSPRSDFSLQGRFDHLNDNEAEIPTSQYNDLNPGSPGTSDAGRTTIGVVRDYVSLQPRFKYTVSPTVNFGATGLYQEESFSPSDTNGHVNFDYFQGDLFVSRRFGERTEVTLGGFGSRFQARSVTSSANAAGGNLGLEYKLTKTFEADLNVTYQRSQVNSTLAPVFAGTTSNWGASGGLAWFGQSNLVRLNLGRTVTPGSGGGLYTADQLQGEWDRVVNERLSYSISARAVGTRGLWSNIGNADRNYIRSDMSAKWMIARTWFVEGGFDYNWQKYHTDPVSAENSQFYVRLGYQGLPPQR